MSSVGEGDFVDDEVGVGADVDTFLLLLPVIVHSLMTFISTDDVGLEADVAILSLKLFESLQF